MAKCHLPQSMTKIMDKTLKKNVIDDGQWQKNCHLLKGIYPHLELSHILPSCLTENVSKQRGVPFFMHLPGIVPSFCEILYLHLICTQLSTSPIRMRRTDRKGEQICNFQMNKYRFSKWTNTFSQAYKYKCRDISEWVPISTSTPAPPWYNGKVTHSAPQHPTTPHRSPSP